MQFNNLTLVKKVGKAVIFKNDKGVEDGFPNSAIKSRKDNDDGTVNIETEDWSFLEDKFKFARVSNMSIIAKNDAGTAIRVEQGEVSSWVPMFAVAEICEEDGSIDMKIDMAKDKDFDYEVVS